MDGGTEDNWLTDAVADGNVPEAVEATLARVERMGPNPTKTDLTGLKSNLRAIERASNRRDDRVADLGRQIVAALKRWRFPEALRLARELEREGIR